MLNLNENVLQRVVDTALASAKNAKNAQKWINAINKAHTTLLENPYVEVIDDHTLLIAGDSGTYTSNGVCQCVAFTRGNPCYHRAAARLYFRYVEAMKEVELSEQRLSLVKRLTVAHKTYAEAQREMNELFA